MITLENSSSDLEDSDEEPPKKKRKKDKDAKRKKERKAKKKKSKASDDSGSEADGGGKKGEATSSRDYRGGFQMRLLNTLVKQSESKDEDWLIAIILANMLESTAMRNLAATSVQFGDFFKKPGAIKEWIQVEAARLLPLFKGVCSLPTRESSDDYILAKMKEYCKEVDSLEILRSIGGITRKTDRVTTIFSFFRQACQKEFEGLVCSEIKKLPSGSVFDCTSALAAPRGVWGIEWKRLCLAVANKYVSCISCLCVPF
jgi:hypothetical protein